MTAHDIWSLAAAAVASDPDRIALDFDDRRWSWGQLTAASEALAAGMSAEGIRRGDVVCTFAPNAAEVVVTFLALLRLGAVEVPVNAGLKGAQLVHVLAHSGATTIVVDGSLGDRLPPDLASATRIGLIVSSAVMDLCPLALGWFRTMPCATTGDRLHASRCHDRAIR